MDTRNKIQSPDGAAAAAAAARAHGEQVRLVIGSFDVLQAAHARDLQAQPGAALFVAVVNAGRAFLHVRARAELVAALRAVRCVIPVDGAPESVMAAINPDEVLDRTACDEMQFRRLIEHVHQRHAG